MNNLFGGVISLVLSVILITAVLVPTIKNANTSGWSTSEIAIFGLCSIMALAGLAYGIGAVFGLV
jgi:hypothetical protein